MHKFSLATLLVFIGADALAQGSPAPIDEQQSKYALFVEDAVCGPMGDFVGFYVSFRLSGEEESESKQRYREIREAWNPERVAIEDLKMDKKQAKLYSELAHRGGALADKYLEIVRKQIESAAADLRSSFPHERLKSEFDGGQIVEPTAAVRSEQQRIQVHQVKAARIICGQLTRSSIQDELKMKAQSSSK